MCEESPSIGGRPRPEWQVLCCRERLSINLRTPPDHSAPGRNIRAFGSSTIVRLFALFLTQRQLRDEFRAHADNTFYKSKEKLADYVAKRRFQPLTEDELDSWTGEIHWPNLLALEADQEIRDPIADAFSKRAAEGQLSAAKCVATSQLLHQWRSELPHYRDSFADSEISEAARFLGRLDLLVREATN